VKIQATPQHSGEKFPRERLLIQSARIGLYLVVLLLAVISQIFQDGFLYWDLLKAFYFFVLMGLLVHSMPLFFLEKFFSHKRLLAASFVADVVFISALAMKTDLNQSLFLFMYLLTIILSGLVFKSQGALLIALLSSAGFSLVHLLGPEMKSMNFLFLLILNNLAFITVAWLSGFLSEQLNVLGERLRAESLTLRTVQKLNQAIVETIPSGLMTTTLDGEILTANLGTAELLKLGDLVGKNIKSIDPSMGEIQPGAVREVPLKVGGNEILAKVSCLLQTSDEIAEQTKLWVFEDLTQIRHLEFAVRQSEKMAAIGQLASGIAHEIRNPLAGISGSIELLSQQALTEDDKKLTKIILREIDRLNNLITEFLDFAKPEKIPHDPVDLNSLLRETVQLAQMQAPSTLELKTEYGEITGFTGSRDKLKQAFLNIIINAYQAMVGAGAPRLEIKTSQNKNGITVRLKDSGSGMPEEVKKRIFEPFMTTKPKGTGLGLAITHKILQSHRAQVFVETSVGVGTEFVIVFSTPSV
jgi:two-component system sensor histidine kinase PilS (NtrC family)